MPTSISPPPERDFPPGQQARRRQQLISIAHADGRPSRRRFWVPMTAAASVVALVAAGVVAVQALRPDGTPRVAASSSIANEKSEKSEKSNETDKTDKPAKQATKPRIPSLVTHEITGDQLREFYDECVAKDREISGQIGEPSEFEEFDRPLFAFTVEMPDSPGFPPTARSYLVAARGDGARVDDRAGCVRWPNSDPDKPQNIWPTAGLLSHEPKGDGFLYQVVGGAGGDGFGFFVSPVAKVTFQPKAKGGVERYAVARDGMWFYPEFTPLPDSADPDDPNTWPENKLILVDDAYYRYRGYDANGKLVYDSERDGPFVSDCYTDPEGKEVIVVNSVKNPTPEKCHRTYEWTAP